MVMKKDLSIVKANAKGRRIITSLDRQTDHNTESRESIRYERIYK